MRLTQVAIERPLFIAILFAALGLFGLLALARLPAELNPRITFPTLTVITIYPGATPEEVETVVTKPIEAAMYSISGVVSVASRSQDNVSVVIIDCALGTDLEATAASAREQLDLVRAQMPASVRAPVVSQFDLNAQPVLLLGVTGNGFTPRQLRTLVDGTLRPRLSRVPGVAAVDVVGGDVREVQVTLRRATLETHGLAMSDVVTGLLTASANVPGGRITHQGRDYAVRMTGEFASLDDIRRAQIPRLPELSSLGAFASLSSLGSVSSLGGMLEGGESALPSLGALGSLMGAGVSGPRRSLTVGEVAEVRDTVQARETRARVQQRESVGLTVTKLAEANTVAVADGIHVALAELRTGLPSGVQTVVLQDQSQRVLDALHDVYLALALGVLLTVVVVFAFLRDLRGTLIVAVAIPTSMLATFIPMHLAGFSLNQMTMLGLALSVGILVDDSIVVLENIHRHLQAGRPPREAALRGREEIGLAALAITLVDVVVFIPIAFMGGVGGQFFQSFALTAAFATMFSLFVSFTLTPALASRWYRQRTAIERATPEAGGAQGARGRRYRALLAGALRARSPLAVAGFAGLGVAAYLGASALEVGLLPRVDAGALRVRLEMPPDSSLDTTEQGLLRAEQVVRQLPEVETVYAQVGQVMGSFAADNEMGRQLGSLLLELKARGKGRTRSDSEVAAQLRERLHDIPGATVTIAPVRGFEGALAPIELQLFGDDLTRLRSVGEELRTRIARLPGVLNPRLSLRLGKPELQVQVDRARAADFDLLIGPAALALRDALEGNTDAKYAEAGNRFNIRVQYASVDRDSPEAVGRIIVGRAGKRSVTVDDIATVKVGVGATEIARKHRRRMATVTAELSPGHSVSAAQARVEAAIRDVPLGEVERKWGGEIEQIAENMLPWLSALGLSVALVYLVLAALYNSLLQPFIVLSGLPMALVGAIAALLLSGEALTMVAIIGLIMLVGLVGKNGILLVDFANTLRARGLDRNAALIEAGATRLRPILMTTCTIIFGMLPIALGLGRGAELRAPMAQVVIGGLLVSTVLTLLLVPVLYTFVDDLDRLLFGSRKEPSS